ncbi:MAG TPA: SRPBCC domain-containing protein [Galbitalea sp.]|nr:SRPBCC domain-containing protein [Galbitalea sp.]
MTDQSFTTTFTVDQSPDEVFAAINNVRSWWTGEVDGDADRIGDEFTYRYEDIHRSTQKVTELVPGKRVVWHVTDAYLSFVKDKDEWVGTDIVFDITEQGDHTEVRFTHVGLVPEVECYDQCTPAWGFYIAGSLRSLITTGQGLPTEREEATA